MPNLSVVIITLNEEKNIGRCLDSVKSIADEIVVVDSRSTDGTEAVCRGYGARVIVREWKGYSAAKNFGNDAAANDLILSIDADEALSSELQASIAAIKVGSPAAAYRFRRLTNYCGKWIRHGGWYPDIKVRIFDRRKTRWQGTIHESLAGIDEKNALLLDGDCLHYTYYTVDEHLRQMQRFTDIMAQDLFSRGKKGSYVHMVGSTAIKFIRDYVLRLGFLDGSKGFLISALSAYATWLKYIKLIRLNRSGGAA